MTEILQSLSHTTIGSYYLVQTSLIRTPSSKTKSGSISSSLCCSKATYSSMYSSPCSGISLFLTENCVGILISGSRLNSCRMFKTLRPVIDCSVFTAQCDKVLSTGLSLEHKPCSKLITPDHQLPS